MDETQESPYVALAISYAARERWQDLDSAMARAEKNVPDDFGALYQAGKLLLLTGKDLPRADRYFRKYLTMEPEGGEPPSRQRTGVSDSCSKKRERNRKLSPKWKPPCKPSLISKKRKTT
jgi:hypothetical protein